MAGPSSSASDPDAPKRSAAKAASNGAAADERPKDDDAPVVDGVEVKERAVPAETSGPPVGVEPHIETPEETAAQVPPPPTPEEAEERALQDEAIHRSPEELQTFLEQARNALLAEGFYSTPMQYRKKAQVFGVIKEHGHDLQIHVRAFANGVIESEVELSNRYIQHLWSPRRSAHAEITKVFEKHGVLTDTINTEFRTRTGADRDQMPRVLTKTRDVVRAGVGLAGAVGAVAIARYIQKRNVPKRERR